MKVLLQNEYKIINLWYPTYVYQFFNFTYNYKNRVLACFQTRPMKGLSHDLKSALHTKIRSGNFLLSWIENVMISCFWLPDVTAA